MKRYLFGLTGLVAVVAAASTLSCDGDGDECELLPARIESDTTVSGCALIERTEVRNGATLTVEPGTLMKFRRDGLLIVNPLQSGAKIIAEARDGEEPITFTSGDSGPEAGSWQCVWVGGPESASSFIGTEFEFGGAPCEANGRKPEGMLVLNAEIERVHDSRFILSSTHHLTLERDGRVRDRVQNTDFRDAGAAAVHLGLNAVLAMGEGNTYDDDDYIFVDTDPNLETSGDWMAQGVPYRLGAEPGTDSADDSYVASINSFGTETTSVRVTPGTEIQLDNGTLHVLSSQLLIEGTEAERVRLTSAKSDPAPGDWGCLLIEGDDMDQPSSIDYAIIEFAGSGVHCTGADYQGGIVIDNGFSNISNTTFSDIDGFASIMSGAPCPEDGPTPGDDMWCRAGNDFAEGIGEIACEFDTVTNCVLDD